MANVKDSRRDLRERAFQALFAQEFVSDAISLSHFAYVYDKATDEDEVVDIPVFLLNLVTGVDANRSSLDQELSKHLKKGWTMERLSAVDRNLLRLGLYEMTYYEETPSRVALNEIIDMAKKYSDETSARFINGILTQYVTD